MVRTGLVAVGLAVALVGAGVIVGLVYPGDDPTVERSGSASVVDLAGGSWRSFLFSASASDPATVSLSWSATANVNVSWYAVQVCATAPGTCVIKPALWTWADAAFGHWADSGAASALYEVMVWAIGSASAQVNFTAAFTEQYRAGQLTLPPIPFAVIMVGGSLLVGFGAVAVYLGLFLPTGVYAPLGPSPRADDAARGPEDDAPPGGPPGPA